MASGPWVDTVWGIEGSRYGFGEFRVLSTYGPRYRLGMEAGVPSSGSCANVGCSWASPRWRHYSILGLCWCYIIEKNMETTIVGIRCFCNLNLNGNNY